MCSISAKDSKFPLPLAKLYVLPAILQMSHNVLSVLTPIHSDHFNFSCHSGVKHPFFFLKGGRACHLLFPEVQVFDIFLFMYWPRLKYSLLHHVPSTEKLAKALAIFCVQLSWRTDLFEFHIALVKVMPIEVNLNKVK